MRSPNIATDADLYEIENLAADPDRTVERTMQRIAPWSGKVVIDVGAGTGFHLDRFHDAAAHVIAVEPDPALRIRMMRRIADNRLERTSVIGAIAVDIPLRDHCVDIVHSRFAYFFGPGCEPGIAELKRIVRPGGAAFIIDNDLRSGTFASWIHTGYPDRPLDPDEIESFWTDQGFTITRLNSCWRFDNRDDLERVVHLEFPADKAARFVADHPSNEIEYNLLLIHRTFAPLIGSPLDTSLTTTAGTRQVASGPGARRISITEAQCANSSSSISVGTRSARIPRIEKGADPW